MDIYANKTLSQTSLSLSFFPYLETITLLLKLHSHFLTSIHRLAFASVRLSGFIAEVWIGLWIVNCVHRALQHTDLQDGLTLGNNRYLLVFPKKTRTPDPWCSPRPSSSLPSTAPCIITQGSPVRSHRALLQIPALSSRTCWNVHCSFGGDKPAALLFFMAPRSWSCCGSLELWPLAHGLHGPIGLQPCK